MKYWTDYTKSEQRKLPNNVKVLLLHRHIREWIAYWCERSGCQKKPFQAQLALLVRYAKAKT